MLYGLFQEFREQQLREQVQIFRHPNKINTTDWSLHSCFTLLNRQLSINTFILIICSRMYARVHWTQLYRKMSLSIIRRQMSETLWLWYVHLTDRVLALLTNLCNINQIKPIIKTSLVIFLFFFHIIINRHNSLKFMQKL